MSIANTGSSNPRWLEQAFVDTAPRVRPRAPHLPNRSTSGQYRGGDPGAGNQPNARSVHTELLADIDGIPVLVRFLVADPSRESPCDLASGDLDLHAVLSTTIAKAAERMGGSRLRHDDRAKRPLATVELIARAEHVTRHSALPTHTVLRVGPLELDLLDRTATRDGRKIDLRPREFQLLKYMMQRSDTLLTRATLFKEVWRYKFVPESNLVDVHMSQLRRKIDGADEFPLIRNVRGAGFILSSPPIPQASMPAAAERTGKRISGSTTSVLDRLLQL